MTTSRQCKPTTGPLLRNLKAKLSRRMAIAFVFALALLMAAALVVPPLALALVLVLPACAVLIIADYAIYWLKSRPIPRHYNSKGKLQPSKIENSLLVIFAYTPMWFWAALTDSEGVGPPFLLALVLMIPLYGLGKLILFRCWLPRKERSTIKTEDSLPS